MYSSLPAFFLSKNGLAQIADKLNENLLENGHNHYIATALST